MLSVRSRVRVPGRSRLSFLQSVPFHRRLGVSGGINHIPRVLGLILLAFGLLGDCRVRRRRSRLWRLGERRPELERLRAGAGALHQRRLRGLQAGVGVGASAGAGGAPGLSGRLRAETLLGFAHALHAQRAPVPSPPRLDLLRALVRVVRSLDQAPGRGGGLRLERVVADHRHLFRVADGRHRRLRRLALLRRLRERRRDHLLGGHEHRRGRRRGAPGSLTRAWGLCIRGLGVRGLAGRRGQTGRLELQSA
mmetsp:Transcript_10423/g.44357  ORF Transcript_10423/g.44357 Transcript_10423/m.44357 type:complete len:251 (-) Transcript_10423:469-1221(-)